MDTEGKSERNANPYSPLLAATSAQEYALAGQR